MDHEEVTGLQAFSQELIFLRVHCVPGPGLSMSTHGSIKTHHSLRVKRRFISPILFFVFNFLFS